jgi:hypothetical protein
MNSRALVSFVMSGLLAATAGCAADVGADAVDDGVEPQQVAANAVFTPLTLVNGWTGAPFNTLSPATALVSGIVHFRGAIKTAGTNPVPFTLPLGRRPTSTVYLPVNLCSATKGRLVINTNGTVTVAAEGGAWANAQCFVSLDGVSFAVSTNGFTPLTLKNGWTNAPFATRNAAVINIGDIIHLAGAIKTTTGNTNMNAIRLPSEFMPSFDSYFPVDLCNGTKGRLWINLGGEVTVMAENGALGNATCFVSLEGVSWGLNPSTAGWNCVGASNGWTGAPFATRHPCVRNDSGIIRVMGAASTTGTNPVPFMLPLGMRPSKDTYVEVDMCDAAQGRVLLQSNGNVTVNAKNGFNIAACFTSFEGVWFSL